jgi:hypothetical protein
MWGVLPHRKPCLLQHLLLLMLLLKLLLLLLLDLWLL